MRLAVLIPVYNAERYLRDCLDSVLAAGDRFLRDAPQTGATGFGIFCCDDGSTDGSAAILEAYAARHPSHLTTQPSTPNPQPSTLNFRVLRQPNAGVVAARNRLMDELPAEYDAFAFVDADDVIRPETYARLAEALVRTGADVAESGWDGPERVIDDLSVFWLRRTSPGAWINVINKIYRRAAVGAIRFRPGLAFEEDFFFNREVNAAIRRKTLVPGRFYTYRDNPDSATHALNLRRYVASTSERVRLTLEVFLAAGRVPAAVEAAYRAELAKDAFRMCLRKNLRRNRDAAERRALFREVGAFLARMERDYGFVPTGLNPVQSLIWTSARRGWYPLAYALAALT